MWKCHLKVNARLYLEVAFNDPNHPTPIIARFDLLSEYSPRSGFPDEPILALRPFAKRSRASLVAPTKKGLYRVHVWITDGKGHAATANAPLEVQ